MTSPCLSCKEIMRLFLTLGAIEVQRFKEVDSFSLYTSHSLEQNTLTGCPICRLFFSQFSSTEVLEMRKQENEDKYLQGYERQYRTRYYFKQRRWLKSLYLERKFNEQDVKTKEVHLISPFEAAGFQPEWLLNPYIPAYKSLDLAKLWLQECSDNHPKCSSLWNRTPILPTRLLHLNYRITPNSLPILRLVEDISPGSPYATLSHVWGGMVPTRLLTSNLNTFKQSIPLMTLPSTFQSAISVSLHLGIEYLWIDSLCIIQDSTSDWLRESSLMGSVYAHAIVNIAATSAGNSRDGLFLNREIGLPTPYTMNLQGKDKSETPYHLLAPKLWDREIESAPLNQRAWVVQERFLSPRTIHFTQHQIFWECSEKVACEIYQKGFTSNEITGYEASPKKLGLRENTPQTISENTGLRFEKSYPIWRDILTTYARQNLTFTTDKLIAISGLAQQWKEQLGVEEEYVAGLWRSYLPQHLLWLAGNQSFHRVTRQEIYRAPTWSWASVDGDFTPRNYIYADHSDDQYVKIQDVKINLLSPDAPFGGVSAASIILCSRLARVEIHIDDSRAREDLSLCLEGTININIRGRKDCNTKENPWAARAIGVYPNLYLLPIAIGSLNPWEGLFIEKAKGDGNVFERWGTWQMWHEKTSSLEMVLGEAFARFDGDAEENGFESSEVDGDGKNLYNITLV